MNFRELWLPLLSGMYLTWAPNPNQTLWDSYEMLMAGRILRRVVFLGGIFFLEARLTSVLAGAVHGGHPGALLAGGRLAHRQVDDVDHGELLVAPQHVGVDVVVHGHGLCGCQHKSFSVAMFDGNPG